MLIKVALSSFEITHSISLDYLSAQRSLKQARTATDARDLPD